MEGGGRPGGRLPPPPGPVRKTLPYGASLSRTEDKVRSSVSRKGARVLGRGPRLRFTTPLAMFRWFQRRKPSYKDVGTFGMASLAEESWRRKMILAAHKLQQAQRTLTSDLVQIQSLHGLLESSEQRIELLAAGLTETQGAVEGLGERLEEHKQLLGPSRPRVTASEGSGHEDDTELFAQSEAAVMKLVERIRELREELPPPAAPNVRTQELARMVSEQEARIAELESENLELVSRVRADPPALDPEMMTRLRALEAHLRQVEMEKVELETRHVQQMIEVADQTRSRIRGLELEIVRRGDRIRALEAQAPFPEPTPLPVQDPFEPEHEALENRDVVSHPGPASGPSVVAKRPTVTSDGLIDSDLFLADEVQGHP